MKWLNRCRILAGYSLGLLFSAAIQAEEAAVKSAESVSLMQMDSTVPLLRLTGSLVVVLILVFVAAKFLQRFHGGKTIAQGDLKVLGGVPVGQKERVVLLQVGDDKVVVGVAPGHVSCLHVVKAAASTTNGDAVFADHLQQAQSETKPHEAAS